LERKEALSILREMLDYCLSSTKFVSLIVNRREGFGLMIKSSYDKKALREFIAKRNLKLKIDFKKGLLFISKP